FLFPPTARPTSAASETYSDMATPGLAERFRAPGMWLTANSRNGRASNTSAVPSARIRSSSAVEISGVFGLASASTAFRTSGRSCPDTALPSPARKTSAPALRTETRRRAHLPGIQLIRGVGGGTPYRLGSLISPASSCLITSRRAWISSDFSTRALANESASLYGPPFGFYAKDERLGA